jgi:hypothetical protein
LSVDEDVDEVVGLWRWDEGRGPLDERDVCRGLEDVCLRTLVWAGDDVTA